MVTLLLTLILQSVHNWHYIHYIQDFFQQKSQNAKLKFVKFQINEANSMFTQK